MTTIREFRNAAPAASIADRACSMGLASYDREENGGRLVVVGRHAIYVCTDANAIGNIHSFDTQAEAVAWSEEMIDVFATAE